MFSTSFWFGVFGKSSEGLAIRSYSPKSVFILAFFRSSTERVSLVSGSSFVMSSKVLIGRAATPAASRLEGICVFIVISRSVVFKIVFSSLVSIKTQPRIGRVERVGVAFDSF